LQFRYRGSRRESAVAQLSTLGGSRFMKNTIATGIMAASLIFVGCSKKNDKLPVVALQGIEAQAKFSFTTNDGVISLTEYKGADANVTIPSKINGLLVTDIGAVAFASQTNVTSVIIPDCVTNIGDMAFDNSGLTNVILGGGITRIRTGAFSCASRLTSITIPASVDTIEGFAFSYCSNLSAVFFDGNAPKVATSAFNGSSIVTIYYRHGTHGWGSTFGGRPTSLGK
jgi:hypothetical protein